MSVVRVANLSSKLLSKNVCLRRGIQQFRLINTSGKNNDSTACKVSPGGEKLPPEKIFVTYGFNQFDDKTDKLHTHLSFFFGVTLCIVGVSFIVAYCPSDKDWEQREAFLELRRREANGLPIVDPNYIDPSLIELPSDEDLGETEVVI